jgi:ABC-type sugar transport system ATPase subunit
MTLADQIALMEEGNIVQCAPPRELYNHPEDQFGGWFLGNPGMAFFTATLSVNGVDRNLDSPLFADRVLVAGDAAADSTVTIGIRPEQIRVSASPIPGGVVAHLERKTVQIGGQYLVVLNVDGVGGAFKAKVAPSVGERLPTSGNVYVALPLTHISLFDSAGNRIAVGLHSASAMLPAP